MSAESWIEIDGVPESELPTHANDGRKGDRVSFLEGGLLQVENGAATFVPWRDVLAVTKSGGGALVLVPRKPPENPWIGVTPAMLGTEPQPIERFMQRVEERSASGGGRGYRDAVVARRQNLSKRALFEKVMSREAIPGALEVPSTIMIGVSYPGLGFTQGAIFMGMAGLGFVAMEALVISAAIANPEVGSMASLFGWMIMALFMAAGAGLTTIVGKKWKEAKNKTLPRQRVLVLAPDGCIAGFSEGIQTLAWSQVGAFKRGVSPATYDEALVVEGPEGETLGSLEAGWLDAPLDLVVRVANAYRDAAQSTPAEHAGEELSEIADPDRPRAKRAQARE
jgi:hypothetical protein